VIVLKTALCGYRAVFFMSCCDKNFFFLHFWKIIPNNFNSLVFKLLKKTAKKHPIFRFLRTYFKKTIKTSLIQQLIRWKTAFFCTKLIFFVSFTVPLFSIKQLKTI
jgi:hypothetical protein